MVDLERIRIRITDFIRFIKEQKHGVMFLDSFLDQQLEDYLEKIQSSAPTTNEVE